MTKKFFWDDPYATSHQSSIDRVLGAEVTVHSTIFYAFWGGQEGDQGTIGGYPVLAARKAGFEIFYRLPDGHGLVPGQEVSIEIDWPRRYRLMRLHFAAELVLELFYKLLPGIEKIGAHIGPDKARIDFSWPDNLSTFFPDITDQANRIIANDLAIKSAFADQQNERRYWEIEGFSRVPCGGTHVRRTGEIGPIQLKRQNPGREKERVEIFLTSEMPPVNNPSFGKVNNEL